MYYTVFIRKLKVKCWNILDFKNAKIEEYT